MHQVIGKKLAADGVWGLEKECLLSIDGQWVKLG